MRFSAFPFRAEESVRDEEVVAVFIEFFAVSYAIFFGCGPFSYYFVFIFSVSSYLTVVVGGPDYNVFLFGLVAYLFYAAPVFFSCFCCTSHVRFV